MNETQMLESPLKDKMDTLNSLSWFFMDASWMFENTSLALVLAPVVIGSGVILLLLDKRPASIAINAAIVSWILMNVLWMYSEHAENAIYRQYSEYLFVSGLLLILLSIFLSKNIRETFSHFRRFRFKRWI